MKNKLFKSYQTKISSIVIADIITNIPRGFFNGIIYLMILGLSIPAINGEAVNLQVLHKYYIYYLCAFVIYIILSILSSTNTFVQSYTISSDIRMKLGEKLRKLSLGYFKSNDPGDVTSRMLHNVSKAEENLSHYLTDYINGLILPILIGSFLCFVNLRLSLILFATVLVSLVFFFIGKKIIFNMGKKHLKVINQASSRILEYTNSIKLLKSYNMIGENFNELDLAMRRLKKLSFQTEVWTGIPVQVALLILDFGYVSMLYFGTKMTISGLISIPKLFSFLILGYYFFEPIKQLGISVVMMRHAKNSTDRIEEVLLEEEPVYNPSVLLPKKNDFLFKNVQFSYKNSIVLDNLTCTIPEKKMTALVGVSGSGKTTITNILARFWDIQQGDLLYGNQSIKEYRPDLLLENMSMVFQDVFLFNDTIYNNIKIGNQDATRDDIIKAAKLAQCHNFIKALPQAYETIISEGGSSLSGGEKQRISIARAILKNAPIVIFDEATASLDPENEFEIQQAIDNLVKDKTIIVIAHKFSTITNANQILVIDQGNIAETGTHHDLISKKGIYNNLWELQQTANSWKIR